MSWGTDSDNRESIDLGNENQWKICVSKIENCFKNIKKQHDDLKGKFDYIQRSRLDMKEIEMKRQNLNPLIQEMSEHINKLDRMVPPTQNTTTIAMKNQVKEIKRRAAEVTQMVQQLCSAINTELYNRQLARKKESSIISQELGTDESRMHNNNQMQSYSLNDPDFENAIEEQKQQAKLTKDIITLENIFVQLSTMCQEQGEVVNSIEGNVEKALDNVDQGEKELTKAVDYKRSALKKKLCIIGIVIAALAALALIIGLSLGLTKK